MKPLNGLKHVQLNLDYKTMLEIKTIADLQKLIQDEIEESTSLGIQKFICNTEQKMERRIG